MINFCSDIISFTISPIEITPTVLSDSTTGRCLTRFFVINAIHSSTVFSGLTYITLLVIISDTKVSLDDLPSNITFRHNLALKKLSSLSFSTSKRTDMNFSINFSATKPFHRVNKKKFLRFSSIICFTVFLHSPS